MLPAWSSEQGVCATPQEVRAACAVVGAEMNVVSLDQAMSSSEDGHQSASGQPKG